MSKRKSQITTLIVDALGLELEREFRKAADAADRIIALFGGSDKSERKTTWRVSYPLRMSPSVIWVHDHDDEKHARTEYEMAKERVEDERMGRWATLQRMTWQVIETEEMERCGAEVNQ